MKVQRSFAKRYAPDSGCVDIARPLIAAARTADKVTVHVILITDPESDEKEIRSVMRMSQDEARAFGKSLIDAADSYVAS